MRLKRRIIFLSVIFIAVLAGCVVHPAIQGPLAPEAGVHPSASFLLPIHNVQILSPYGPRGKRFHTGIDLRGRRGGGDAVLASRPGRVTLARRLSGYGNIVALLHEDGFTTRYAHLKKITVKLGQKVKALQDIGLVGRTGRATTAHLHFEILTPKQRFLDPEPYLFKNKYK